MSMLVRRIALREREIVELVMQLVVPLLQSLVSTSLKDSENRKPAD